LDRIQFRPARRPGAIHADIFVMSDKTPQAELSAALDPHFLVCSRRANP
jgi:hypothetical protein